MSSYCEWILESGESHWDTICGETFEFTDQEGPIDHRFAFCPFCGCIIKETMMDDMKVFQIWTEGFAATGEHGAAYKMGAAKAESFEEACQLVCGEAEFQKRHGTFDPESLSVWGCRLFDNEKDARKGFG